MERAIEHDECVVCFDPLYSKEVCCLYDREGKRICRHYFHHECVTSVQTRYVRSCPVCRVEWTIATKLTNPLKDARAFFDMLDADHSGSLSKNEVLGGLKACLDLDWRHIDQSVDVLWTTWDRDKGGSISFEEFTQPRTGLLDFVVMNHPERTDCDRVREPPNLRERPRDWFQFWDEDGSNSLETGEIVRALVKTFRVQLSNPSIATIAETVEAVFPLFDPDGSGSIDISEFTMRDGLCDTIIASLQFT